MFSRIVLHLPHASPVIPFGVNSWDRGVEKEIERWTDWYSDWLFLSPDPRVIPVAYPFSRFFCDVERLQNDPLDALGQGIVYRRFGELERRIPKRDVLWAQRSYSEHHGRLRALIDEGTLLVDCHSFPSDLSDVEICIGVNDDWSRPPDRALSLAVEHFSKAGYRVGLNNPYSNAVSPECGFLYSSLMIELNKKTYMDGNRELDRKKSERMRATIQGFYESILNDC